MVSSPDSSALQVSGLESSFTLLLVLPRYKGVWLQRMASWSCCQCSWQALRLEVQEEGNKSLEGLHVSMPPVARQTLNTTCPGGYIELSFSPLEPFLLVPLSLRLF